MTLREAVERVERFVNVTFPPLEDARAFKLLLDTARERLDDTAEIVLPCRTCVGMKDEYTVEIVVCKTTEGTE